MYYFISLLVDPNSRSGKCETTRQGLAEGGFKSPPDEDLLFFFYLPLGIFIQHKIEE